MEQVLQVWKGELLQYVKAEPECKGGLNLIMLLKKIHWQISNPN